MTFICCVPGCGENGKKLFHSFPKNQQQCKKWIQATWSFFLNEETAWKTHYKVCRKHFQATDFKNWNLLNKDVVPSLSLPHSITMEHDYCTRNSIVVNANLNVSERNLLQEMNNNNSPTEHECDCLPTDQAMEFVEEVRQIEDVKESATLLNEPEIDENLTEEDIGSKVISGNSTDDRALTISQPNTSAIRNDGDICTEKVTDDRKLEFSVSADRKLESAMSAEVKAKSTYDPVARKMRYLLARNKRLAKRLKDSQSANLKSNKKSKVKKKIDLVLKTLALELPPAHYNFINLQIKNTGRAKKGNRFTLEEKTLALVIYKQNPKRYNDLLKMANLPTKRTLIAHSAAIRFKEGINQNLMDFIQKEVSQMGELDKMCTIGWDEMSLTANLSFDQIKDYIDGFEDIVTKRTNDFATHALVFMVRGVKLPFKQPIAYFLTQNINAAELAELIKLVIQAVTDTGLKVIGSVCDAVVTNRAAVNKLIHPNNLRVNTTGELLEYTVNGVKIWHYFDPPHLIKSVRNNLLIKDLSHNVSFNETKFRPNGEIVWNEKNKQQRTASWKDIRDFYTFNNTTGLFNLLPNITDEHIDPLKRKMKVSLATQVFSGTYGRNMYLCAKRKQFTNDCLGTSAVLLFFNELFDSVNGNDVPIPQKLIGAVTAKSEHFKFWDYAIRMLDNMIYSENLTTGSPNESNVCKHFVSTLKAFRKICEHLFETGFDTIGLRRLNQDGLENHFFKIRSYCGSNQKPNARDFRNAYTTAIFSSQMTSHSLNANCEADEDKYVLQNLHLLFEKSNDSGSYTDGNMSKCAELMKTQDDEAQLKTISTTKGEPSSSDSKFVENEAQNCISGKICKELMAKFKCENCFATVAVTANKKTAKCIEHEIMRKQSSADDLMLPKIEFIECIRDILSKAQMMLPLLCSEKNLKKKLLSGMPYENNNYQLIGCENHRKEFVYEMRNRTAMIVIERFTQQVNRILSGKVCVATQCIIQMKALKFRAKKKNIGKYVPPVSQQIA